VVRRCKPQLEEVFQRRLVGQRRQLLDVLPALAGEHAASAAPERPRLDLRLDFSHGRELLGLAALVRRHLLIELFFHVVLEGLGLGLVIHGRDCRRAAETRDECSAIDFHASLLIEDGVILRRSWRCFNKNKCNRL
jgi:hypothetical protein